MSEAIQLATTGLLMGFIHVLAGPDHLSALATLSGTNVRSDNNYVHSFLLGIKWGLGHAFGLIIVGAILIAIDIPVNNGSVSNTLEAFVGVFMLVLGAYGMHKAFRHRSSVIPIELVELPSPNENLHKIVEHDEEDYEDSANPRSSILCEMTQVLNEDSERWLDVSLKSNTRGRVEEGTLEEMEDEDDVESRIFKAARSIGKMTELGGSFMSVPMNSLQRLSSSIKSVSSVDSGSNLLKKSPSQLLLERHEEMLEQFGGTDNGSSSCKAEHTHEDIVPTTRRTCTTGALAVLTGLVHGVAGPGGVLGIIPAVQLRDPYLSSIYLGTFCFTSCLVMGGFAAFYGTFSKWLAGGEDGSTHRVFLVEVGSASLSIFVGLIWIILLSVGKLEDIFP
mmetsp:Transcript_11905/g.17769  ORF Transcript_11905/g.17769 Transcript_11905/m.17769 type:complete len:392 (-) Transcript_11905:78-1253(-)